MLYDALAGAAPGAVVEVNRAVAHGRAYGATAGMAVLDPIDPAALGDSPILPSARGDLLERAGIDDAEAGQFRRYGSARELYSFTIDNAGAY